MLEVVVDRVTLDPVQIGRLTDSLEQALDLGRGVIRVAVADKAKPEPEWTTKRFSLHAACETCDRSFEPLSPAELQLQFAARLVRRLRGAGQRTRDGPVGADRRPHPQLARRRRHRVAGSAGERRNSPRFWTGCRPPTTSIWTCRSTPCPPRPAGRRCTAATNGSTPRRRAARRSVPIQRAVPEPDRGQPAQLSIPSEIAGPRRRQAVQPVRRRPRAGRRRRSAVPRSHPAGGVPIAADRRPRLPPLRHAGGQRTEGRRRSTQGGDASTRLPGGRRADVSHAGSVDADALRRGIAADSARRAGRAEPHGGALRTRRTDDRPAPAGQRPVADGAEKAPRSGQYDRARRA